MTAFSFNTISEQIVSSETAISKEIVNKDRKREDKTKDKAARPASKAKVSRPGKFNEDFSYSMNEHNDVHQFSVKRMSQKIAEEEGPRMTIELPRQDSSDDFEISSDISIDEGDVGLPEGYTLEFEHAKTGEVQPPSMDTRSHLAELFGHDLSSPSVSSDDVGDLYRSVSNKQATVSIDPDDELPELDLNSDFSVHGISVEESIDIVQPIKKKQPGGFLNLDESFQDFPPPLPKETTTPEQIEERPAVPEFQEEPIDLSGLSTSYQDIDELDIQVIRAKPNKPGSRPRKRPEGISSNHNAPPDPGLKSATISGHHPQARRSRQQGGAPGGPSVNTDIPALITISEVNFDVTVAEIGLNRVIVDTPLLPADTKAAISLSFRIATPGGEIPIRLQCRMSGIPDFGKPGISMLQLLIEEFIPKRTEKILEGYITLLKLTAEI